MPFVPRYQEVSDSLICDNVMAIVKRDFKPCIDVLYPTDALADFAQRTLGEFGNLALPSFAISPRSNGPMLSADGSWIDETLKLSILMAVSDADAPAVTRKAMKYVRALKSVLRTASVADYTSGFPSNSIFALTPEISYEYGLIGKNANDSQVYEKVVIVDLTLKFNER